MSLEVKGDSSRYQSGDIIFPSNKEKYHGWFSKKDGKFSYRCRLNQENGKFWKTMDNEAELFRYMQLEHKARDIPINNLMIAETDSSVLLVLGKCTVKDCSKDTLKNYIRIDSRDMNMADKHDWKILNGVAVAYIDGNKMITWEEAVGVKSHNTELKDKPVEDPLEKTLKAVEYNYGQEWSKFVEEEVRLVFAKIPHKFSVRMILSSMFRKYFRNSIDWNPEEIRKVYHDELVQITFDGLVKRLGAIHQAFLNDLIRNVELLGPNFGFSHTVASECLLIAKQKITYDYTMIKINDLLSKLP